MTELQVRQVETPIDIKAVREIFLEYLDFVERYLGQDLSFQGLSLIHISEPTRPY